MFSGVWLVRRGKLGVAKATTLAVTTGPDDPVDLDSAARRVPAWLSWVALLFGILFVGFGFAFVIGGVAEKEAGLFVATAVMAIPGVLLIRFGLGPWNEKKKQLESELPDALSRRQRRNAVREIQRQEAREKIITTYQVRRVELIERLEIAGHQPHVDAVWVSGEGARWHPVLSCQKCGRMEKKPLLRRSRRLSPDHPCAAVV